MLGGLCSRVPAAEWNLTRSFEGTHATFLIFIRKSVCQDLRLVLAVGDDPEPDVLLPLDDVADGRLLDRQQLLAGDLALRGLFARVDHACGRMRLPT